MPARGNKLPQAKLNPDLVRQIRGSTRTKAAWKWAEELNCHIRTIEKARNYGSWKQVR